MLRKASSIGKPFELKGAHSNGYLATNLAVTLCLAPHKMPSGRVLQPLVGQPAMPIGTKPLLRKTWCIIWLVGHPLNPQKQIRMGILRQVGLSHLTLRFAKCFQGESNSLLWASQPCGLASNLCCTRLRASGNPLNQKEQIIMGILQQIWLSQLAGRLTKCLQGESGSLL